MLISGMVQIQFWVLHDKYPRYKIVDYTIQTYYKLKSIDYFLTIKHLFGSLLESSFRDYCMVHKLGTVCTFPEYLLPNNSFIFLYGRYLFLWHWLIRFILFIWLLIITIISPYKYEYIFESFFSVLLVLRIELELKEKEK